MAGLVSSLRRTAFLLRCRVQTRPHRFGAFGQGSVIVPPAMVLAPHRIEIGDGVLIFERAAFSVVEEHWGGRYEPRLRVGDRSVIGRDVWFSCVGEIEIGTDALISHGVLIADSFHEYRDLRIPILRQPMATPRKVTIGTGAMIGPGAAILSGATVGDGASVLAGAVLAGEVPPYAIAAGNPAEVIRRWDSSTERWIDSDDPRWAATLASLTR